MPPTPRVQVGPLADPQRLAIQQGLSDTFYATRAGQDNTLQELSQAFGAVQQGFNTVAHNEYQKFAEEQLSAGVQAFRDAQIKEPFKQAEARGRIPQGVSAWWVKGYETAMAGHDAEQYRTAAMDALDKAGVLTRDSTPEEYQAALKDLQASLAEKAHANGPAYAMALNEQLTQVEHGLRSTWMESSRRIRVENAVEMASQAANRAIQEIVLDNPYSTPQEKAKIVKQRVEADYLNKTLTGSQINTIIASAFASAGESFAESGNEEDRVAALEALEAYRHIETAPGKYLADTQVGSQALIRLTRDLAQGGSRSRAEREFKEKEDRRNFEIEYFVYANEHGFAAAQKAFQARGAALGFSPLWFAEHVRQQEALARTGTVQENAEELRELESKIFGQSWIKNKDPDAEMTAMTERLTLLSKVGALPTERYGHLLSVMQKTRQADSASIYSSEDASEAIRATYSAVLGEMKQALGPKILQMGGLESEPWLPPTLITDAKELFENRVNELAQETGKPYHELTNSQLSSIRKRAKDEAVKYLRDRAKEVPPPALAARGKEGTDAPKPEVPGRVVVAAKDFDGQMPLLDRRFSPFLTTIQGTESETKDAIKTRLLSLGDAIETSRKEINDLEKSAGNGNVFDMFRLSNKRWRTDTLVNEWNELQELDRKNPKEILDGPLSRLRQGSATPEDKRKVEGLYQRFPAFIQSAYKGEAPAKFDFAAGPEYTLFYRSKQEWEDDAKLYINPKTRDTSYLSKLLGRFGGSPASIMNAQKKLRTLRGQDD